jgi:hypothetical protein
MAKIPVVKSVQRNGQVHTQTYWEEDDKETGTPSLLANLGVSKPRTNTRKEFPKDIDLENNWRMVMGDNGLDDPYVEAAVAAGLTFAAADHLAKSLPEWESLSDHVYENNLDEMPRPKGGWKCDRMRATGDERSAWLREEVPLETAVEWVDAGFGVPYYGIPDLIRAGVDVERAKAWSDDMARTSGKTNGGALYLANKELTSGIELEDARQYRAEFFGDASRHLGDREIEFMKKGVVPSVAGRWHKITYESVPVDDIIKLRDLKWSPSLLKSTMRDLYGSTGAQARFGRDVAEILMRVTPQLGSPKVVAEWSKYVRQVDMDTEFSMSLISSINDAEAFKKRAFAETGVKIEPEHHHELAGLLPLQREAYLALMNTEGREKADVTYRVPRTMTLAKAVASAENLQFLKDKGFVFGDKDTGKPIEIPYAPAGYDVFNAAEATEESRNRWMKSLSFHMYSRKTRQDSHRDRFVNDDRVDPIRLRDALMNDPEIDDMRLEALLIGNIASPITDGWL